MRKIYLWYKKIPKRKQDSISYTCIFIGALSTILSILGISLGDIPCFNLLYCILIVVAAFLLVYLFLYFVLGRIFKNSVNLTVRNTEISVCYGDIFAAKGLRVINCDTRYDTRVDDKVISKSSLHGQLFSKYGNEIAEIVKTEARARNITPDTNGQYTFPLGTIIRYDCKTEKKTYLLLAMTELNEKYEAHTDTAKFESMLMTMWREIDRVYAREDVALPLLGSGITRFDDGSKKNRDLLRCMLCTLNSSGVTLKSKVKILLYDSKSNRDNDLYEYKDLF